MRPIFREYGLPILLLAASVLTTTANGARFMVNFLEGMPPVVRDSDLWPWGWLWKHPASLHSWLAVFLYAARHPVDPRVRTLHCLPRARNQRDLAVDSTCADAERDGWSGDKDPVAHSEPQRADGRWDLWSAGRVCGFGDCCGGWLCAEFQNSSRCARCDCGIRKGADHDSSGAYPAGALGPGNPFVRSKTTPHPVLVAGWIGLFITSLNLIPGGRLDGGHLLYAISPRAHTLFTKLLPFILFLAGVFFWVGWILWGAILLIPAMRHPRVPVETNLSGGRLALGCIGLVIFLMTFTPTPFEGNSLMQLLRPDPIGATQR